MDPTASVVLLAQLTTFKTDTITMVTSVLPIALGVLITVVLISVGVKTFLHIAGVRGF